MCPLSYLYHVSTARRISLGDGGNALYSDLLSLVTAVNMSIADVKTDNYFIPFTVLF